MFAIQDPQSWLPKAASSFADHIDPVWRLTFWLCVFFFVLITGILLYSVLKWRRRTPEQPAAADTTHNTMLEVVWTLVPLVIMMVLFAMGWRGVKDMTVAPTDCLQYKVIAEKWNWTILHPGATGSYAEQVEGYADPLPVMYVPVNTNVKVHLQSKDVLHSFYVPEFRCKRDVVPGRMQFVWFRATELGVYQIKCAEYCGDRHSYMRGLVKVVTQEEYDEKPWMVIPDDPIEYGKLIWQALRACKQCHTIDGSEAIGPTFKGLWGKTETLVDGSTVVVDRDYVAKSIRTPQADIVKGFENAGAMTAYNDITEAEIDAICAFLESIK